MVDGNIPLLSVIIHGVIAVLGTAALLSSIRRLPQRMPEELFLACLVIIHGILPLLVGPRRLYAAAPDVHFEAAVAALFTLVSFLLTREVLRGFMLQDKRAKSAERPQHDSGLIAVLLFFVGLLAFCIAIYSTRGGLQLGAERLAGRDQSSFLSAILVNIGFLVLVAPWHFARRRQFAIAGGFVVTLLVFFTLAFPGTRLFIVYVVGSVVSGYILQETSWKRATVVLLGAGMMIAFVAILTYQARRFASYGLIDSLQSGYSFIEFDDVPEPFNYHRQTILAVESLPDANDWFWGDSYTRILFAVVPEKYSFGLKPRDTNLRFAEACDFRLGGNGVTIPPSVPGEGYVNFGLWGSLLSGIIYAFVFRTAVRVWQSASRLSYVVSAALFGVAVMAVRGQLYDLLLLVLVFASAGYCIVWAAEFLLTKSFTKKRTCQLDTPIGPLRKRHDGGARV
ncbi:MAG: oligosaccharide repeat unit polymerase [Planctomycetaceae bacterium]